MSKCSGPGRAGTPACQKRFEFRRPRFLSRYLLLAVAVAGGSVVAAAAPPNLIVILPDDLGCGDMSLYNGWIKTPRIDQMAREGVWFTDFHSNSSVCSPTRAALLTGRCGCNAVCGSRTSQYCHHLH
jgi:hypothetical protein